MKALHEYVLFHLHRVVVFVIVVAAVSAVVVVCVCVNTGSLLNPEEGPLRQGKGGERRRCFDPSIPVSWQEFVPMFPLVDKVSIVEDFCVDLEKKLLLLLNRVVAFSFRCTTKPY